VGRSKSGDVMAYTTKTTTGLRVTTAYGASDWVSVHNYNMERLNSTLLKLSGLVDVDVSGLSAGMILVYSASAGKFVARNPPRGSLVVMVTTTSTTTTSTTTTTT